jgi:hypothetical protein
MRSYVRFTALLTGLAMSATNVIGCALIVQGRKEDIKFTSIPSGAVVKANDRQIITPGEISFKRSTDHKVTFEKEGFPARETTLESTGSWWLLGNLFFGGIIGLIVDLATGSGYRLKPSNVEMDMASGAVKEKAGQTEEKK